MPCMCGDSECSSCGSAQGTRGEVYPPVLDATCGSRAMWFNKNDERALFFDRRDETLLLPKGKAWPNGGELHIHPDVQGNFTDMPFPDNTFTLVVFDPPHMEKLGEGSNLGKFYGKLFGDWECELAKAFEECFRILRDNGILIFKWCSIEIPLSRVLALTPHAPMFGHNTGNHAKTHWCVFMKPNIKV